MNVFPDITFVFHLVIYLTTIMVAYHMVFKPFLEKILERQERMSYFESKTTELAESKKNKETLIQQQLEDANKEAFQKASSVKAECLKEEKEAQEKSMKEAHQQISQLKKDLEKSVTEEIEKIPDLKMEVSNSILEKLKTNPS